MTTDNTIQRQQPSLQSLYDKATQDISNGNTQGAQQVMQRAAAAYAKANPGATVQDFENAFAAAETGKVSSAQINNVVNQVLPSGDDASTTGVSAIASHGGGDVSASTNSYYDPSTGQYVTQ